MIGIMQVEQHQIQQKVYEIHSHLIFGNGSEESVVREKNSDSLHLKTPQQSASETGAIGCSTEDKLFSFGKQGFPLNISISDSDGRSKDSPTKESISESYQISNPITNTNTNANPNVIAIMDVNHKDDGKFIPTVS